MDPVQRNSKDNDNTTSSENHLQENEQTLEPNFLIKNIYQIGRVTTTTLYTLAREFVYATTSLFTLPDYRCNFVPKKFGIIMLIMFIALEILNTFTFSLSALSTLYLTFSSIFYLANTIQHKYFNYGISGYYLQ